MRTTAAAFSGPNCTLPPPLRVTVIFDLSRPFRVQAHWALSKGFRAGDVVALFMMNRPEFIIFWLGMAKIGVVTSFLNHNLRGM